MLYLVLVGGEFVRERGFYVRVLIRIKETKREICLTAGGALIAFEVVHFEGVAVFAR